MRLRKSFFIGGKETYKSKKFFSKNGMVDV